MLKTAKIIPIEDPHNNEEKRAVIDRILDEYKHISGSTMVVLNQLQGAIGHISPAMQVYVANRLGQPVSHIHGVVSFYSFFTTKPRGKHTIKFCVGTACYVSSIDQIIEKAKQVLGIGPGETTEDGLITLELCRCAVVLVLAVRHLLLSLMKKFKDACNRIDSQDIQKSEVSN